MSKGGWQRPLVDATVLWMAVFPVLSIFADLLRARSLNLSGATYFWAYAFRGDWGRIIVNLGLLAIFVVLTAAVLRFTGRRLFA